MKFHLKGPHYNRSSPCAIQFNQITTNITNSSFIDICSQRERERGEKNPQQQLIFRWRSWSIRTLNIIESILSFLKINMNYEKWPFNLGSNFLNSIDAHSFFIFNYDFMPLYAIDCCFSIPFTSIESKLWALFRSSTNIQTNKQTHIRASNLWILFLLNWVSVYWVYVFLSLWLRHEKWPVKRTKRTCINITNATRIDANRMTSIMALRFWTVYISKYIVLHRLNSIVAAPHMWKHWTVYKHTLEIEQSWAISTSFHKTYTINEMTAISITSLKAQWNKRKTKSELIKW